MTDPVAPGFSHPRYAVERELGRGGMATVFRARDLERGRDVALKVLHDDLSTGSARERFVREIRVAGGLVHPHILTVLDAGEAGGKMFYTMPCVDGESLRQRLEREGQLPLESVRRITSAIAAALDHAHSQGVVHRDIKPENILLVRDSALVSDFGIARALADPDDQRVTTTGMIVGTPAYMSPEQASGGALDSRTDVYSLGAVVYEMLAGHAPFAGGTPRQVMARLVIDPPPPLRTVRPGCSPALENAVARALAKDPDMRFSTAGEFATALAASDERAPPIQRRHRRPVVVVGLAAAAAIAIAVSALMLRTDAPSAVALPLVAVLPFEDDGVGDTDPYVAFTLREDIASALAGSGAVRVVRAASAPAGANFVLSGVVSETPTGRAISLALIRPGERLPMFSTTANAQQHDLRFVPSTVAARLITAIGGPVDPRRWQYVRPPPSGVSPEAFDLYLRGRYQLARRTQTAVARAFDLFNQAIQLDSNFARAWAGAAQTAMFARLRGLDIPGVRSDSLLAAALAASDRAVELDPNDSDVHLTRARLALQLEPATREAALNAIARSLAADSMNADAWRQLGLVREELLQPDAAAAALRKALSIDPGHLEALAFLALHHVWAGRFREGLVWADSAIALDPTYVLARDAAAELHIELGELDAAERNARTFLQLSSGRERVGGLVNLTRTAALRTVVDSARALMREAEALARPPLTVHESVWLAHGHLAVGDTAAAVATLRAFSPSDDLHFLLHVRRDPPLRRFNAEQRLTGNR